MDSNNAHIHPTGEYHYHGVPKGFLEGFDDHQDLVHVGFVKDGFPMYYSKSAKYKASYRLIDGKRKETDCSYSNKE